MKIKSLTVKQSVGHNVPTILHIDKGAVIAEHANGYDIAYTDDLNTQVKRTRYFRVPLANVVSIELVKEPEDVKPSASKVK